ncbi:MAG: hypothetical protein ACXWV9_11760 [Flavisolibacter sp.]
MDKVYLILRNNRQTGPYTIGELLQQQLRLTDMIWIEGTSTAWAYLSEMQLNPSIENVSSKEEKSRVVIEPAKRPTTSSTPAVPENNTPKRRSSPPDEIERKAEELRKQAFSAGPHYSRFTDPQINFEEFHSRVLIPVEEEIDFVDHREQKKLPVLEIVSGVFVTAFVVACFFGGRSLIVNQQSAPPTIVAAKEVSTTEYQAKTLLPATTAITLVTNNEVIETVDSKIVDSAAITKKTKPKTLRPNSSIQSKIKSGSAEKLIEPIAAITKKEENSVSIPEVIPSEEETKKAETEKKDLAQQTVSINSEAQAEEKKKGLFKKIFGKKKKEE